MGPLIPLFWTPGDVSSGFQSQSGQPYSNLAEVYILHIPWDSPLVWHLPTSWQPAWQPSRLFHIPARHWWDSKPGAIMPPLTVWDQAGRTFYRLSYPGSAFLCAILFFSPKDPFTPCEIGSENETFLWWLSSLLAIIALSGVRWSAQTFIHNAILFIVQCLIQSRSLVNRDVIFVDNC